MCMAILNFHPIYIKGLIIENDFHCTAMEAGLLPVPTFIFMHEFSNLHNGLPMKHVDISMQDNRNPSII